MVRPWKDSREWARNYLVAHPDSSVDEIARAADAEGVPLAKELASQVRRDFRLARVFTPATNLTPAAPSLEARCERCGQQGHWISQCPVIVEPPPSVPVQTYVEEVEPEEALPVEEEKAAVVEEKAPAPTPAPSKEAGRARSVEGTFVRRQRLNAIVDVQPDIHPLQAVLQLREEFGIALDFNYVYETCRLAREVHGLPPLRSREDPGNREFGEREKVTVVAAAAEEAAELTPDEELAWIATRIGEIVRAHNLSDVNIRTENGELVWDYEIRLRKSGKQAL